MRVLFFTEGTNPEPWLAGFRAALPGAQVDFWQPGAAPADYAVVWHPPQQLIDEQPQLKAVFNMGAGVDALTKLRFPAGTPLVRLDDAGMAIQMAEYVCHALIRHFREFDAYEADVQAGRWSYRKPRDRSDFPVGIMGLGVLGEHVAQTLMHFEFPLAGWSRTPRQIPGMRCFAGAEQFHDFLAATRVLVCLLPLTPATENIINRDTLSRLKPGAFVINVARGKHLVDEDLLAMIESGHVAGAALDVFRTEPLPAGHAFIGHPKITVTPHTSARTLREKSIAQVAGKILAFSRGEPIAGVVDPERGY